MLNNTNILLRQGYLLIPEEEKFEISLNELVTVLVNLEYYGYALSNDVYQALRRVSKDTLYTWWAALETELRIITGDDRNIGNFVVYKNFPTEVLNKSESEYWISQILMYWGLPNEYFTEEVISRKGMNPEERKSKTLMLASNITLQNILDKYLLYPVKWKQFEYNDVIFLSTSLNVSFEKISFKENLIKLASYFIDDNKLVSVKTATDVLRLGAGLSGGDISLKEKVRFKSFNRKTRRFLLNMLEGSTNIEEDIARHKNVWKKFLHNLHAGDFKKSYPNVIKAADNLYNDNIETFNSKIELMIINKDKKIFDLLITRPGEFARRLAHVADIFGELTVGPFISIVSKLSTLKIVMLRRQLEYTNIRTSRVFPPKGNWSNMQIGKVRHINQDIADSIILSLSQELFARVPSVGVLDPETVNIKLSTNGSDTGIHTRGTVFKIPKSVKFIRTASYWEKRGDFNTWFDNGWNFFDKKWKQKGACCWTNPNYIEGSAIFSGDPTNSKEMNGRAAQMIDLYPDKLVKADVRYAVWNVLCYSNIPFSDATDVFAALQWGEDPQAGKLFEPSRCQLSFPLIGNYKTKYVCVLDLETKELIYIDLSLKSSVRSAAHNCVKLSEKLPLFMEYIRTLPSIYDLFKESISENSKIKVLYSDRGVELNPDNLAYVFLPQGGQDYKKFDIEKILNS
jgi:hypothetical protein